MNRRGFIGALLGAAVLDPERLLFVPGRKVYSIPSPKVFTTCLTTQQMADCRAIVDRVVDYHYSKMFAEAHEVKGYGWMRLSGVGVLTPIREPYKVITA